MPEFRRRFDVEIIPFRLSALTHATDPVKLYEAAAAGRAGRGDADGVARAPRAAGRRAARRDAGGVRPRDRGRGAARAADGAARQRAFARENTWDVRARGARRTGSLTSRPRRGSEAG